MTIKHSFNPSRFASWVCACLLLSLMAARAAEEPAVQSGAPAAVSETDAFDQAMTVFKPAMDASKVDRPVDFARLRTAMEEFWAQHPEAHAARVLLTRYMVMFEKAHPEATLAEWSKYTASRSPVAARLAQGKVRFAELSKQPFELKFTAMDGREVDLAQLRGKVVFVNFWATWCPPCLAELPQLKQTYAKYHDRGFEVVGISLDPAEDREKLTRFIERQEVPWPQHFDGKKWDNEFVGWFGISSIPTTFLLDRDGRLAKIDVEAEKLAREVELLLRFQPVDQKTNPK